MKFLRKAQIFHGGRLDFAPFASVFFLLVIFLVFSSLLVLLPGVKIQQPQSARPNLPHLQAAIADGGQIDFDDQRMGLEVFHQRLVEAAAQSGKPPALTILMDEVAGYEMLSQVYQTAVEAGITEIFLTRRAARFEPAGQSSDGQ